MLEACHAEMKCKFKKLSHVRLWGSNPQAFVKQALSRKVVHLVAFKIVIIKLKRIAQASYAHPLRAFCAIVDATASADQAQTPESSMAVADLGSTEWERSKISSQDINLLKKLGISKKPKVCFPSEESYPTPPMGYRVSFVDHLIRGLSAPIHPFLRGLLFVYGLQLHHLSPY
ncbi:hypothetical protein QYE76_029032 [Lolium multiflorum]|uniref:Transposase (putative) gypsy type domain-containing protein n=1 Tax=Lolium multiflorum TaxID=4521 RepID=A0AAD8VGB2_LOLMU|nr:hypothetical protein QYE76_029032 [Lolium multiflorum]